MVCPFDKITQSSGFWRTSLGSWDGNTYFHSGHRFRLIIFRDAWSFESRFCYSKESIKVCFSKMVLVHAAVEERIEPQRLRSYVVFQIISYESKNQLNASTKLTFPWTVFKKDFVIIWNVFEYWVTLMCMTVTFLDIPVEILIFQPWIIAIDISDPNMFVDKSFWHFRWKSKRFI